MSGTSVNVTSNTGEDLQFTITNSGAAGDGMTVAGPQGATVALTGNGTTSATVGGSVNLTLNNGYTITSNGGGTALFANTIQQTSFRQNSFDPSDPNTYNKSTNVKIYDSHGMSHDLRLFYVKQNDNNHWMVYAQVDGKDVGDPTSSASTTPTRAAYNIYFNKDGTLDSAASTPVRITNWTPVDASGAPNGSYTGLTVANGATFPPSATDPNSNFYVDLTGTTEYGNEFAQNNLSQDGYTTGRLSSLDIGSDGRVYARYTNGQSKVLAQVALTNFSNPNGLRPVGDTSWVETLDSGTPIVGAPGTSAMGVIQGGALEESNVELSSELVDLIVAQRNFQANAKTIQTADAITQAIINIR
ncbi:MAG TPA: flagellar hook-basal body complex protein [Methanosarcina sp.]|nr:flagellar hook-basal body complex protein [Methanosarcina sp.]